MRSALLLLLGVLLAAAFDSVLAADDDEIDVDGVDAGGDSVDVEDGANAAAGEDLRVAVKEVLYTAPQLNGEAFFSETFDKGLARWLKSEAKKDGVDEEIAKYAGEWAVEEAAVASVKGDVGLVMKSKAKHHAIAVLLDKPFEFKDAKSFIIQYEVKFQNGMECGGAYVKLLSKNADGEEDLKRFTDKTPYTVMFGPDKCGSDSKLHFIVRHRNPKTGEYSEKHGKKASSLPELYDKNSHLFRLTLGSDNSWEVRVDGSIVNAGSLLDDMEPPINPPAEIDDPSDSKPEDWDDRKKIPDPDATKPDDWDENEPEKIVDESAAKPSDWLEDEAAMIPDPTATKPDDWDNDMDGDWEAPLVSNPKCSSAAGCGPWTAPQIPNPKYKGKWRAPMIDNPSYKGTWKARRIANPEFFEDKAPFSGLAPIAAVGLELWSMTDGVLFDNFLVTDSGAVADSWAETGWYIKRDVELASKAATEAQSSVVGWIKKSYEEKPWLVIACAAVPVIVILLIVYTCCCTASKKDEAAVTKKTDAVTPDDVHDAGQEKDGADSEKEDEPPKAAGDAKPSAAAKPAASESSDDDAKNKGGESSTGEDSQSPLRRSARRKPRKDT